MKKVPVIKMDKELGLGNIANLDHLYPVKSEGKDKVKKFYFPSE